MKVYGDYHTHTQNSDGKNTIDENVAAAQKRGLQQVAITDHAHYRPRNAQKRLEKALLLKAQTIKAGKVHGIETFYGVEANVKGTHGEIDVSNDERKIYDLVVCGIHASVPPKRWYEWFTFYLPNLFWYCLRRMLHVELTPKGRIRKNTRAVVNVIEKNNIDILAHPNRYFRLDVMEVAKACVARGTVMELNNKHISFRPIDFERMVAMGVKFVIDSDSHKAENVGRMDRVESFLKLCDYDPSCIINLSQPFARPKAALLSQIVEAAHGSDEVR